MALDIEWFAVSFLKAPLIQRTERGRLTAHERHCVACKQTVFLDSPLEVTDSIMSHGHLPDCRALFIYANGFGGQAGGGGSGAITLARDDITLATPGITLASLTN